ncbi:MAG: helix-turn-helix domain-containing protein [Kineosporiaceae bacterium]|nr:helix-turn-helix domain-containing protein [Kineosporiaceae bacterium]
MAIGGGAPNPAIVRLDLAARLRELRLASDLSIESVAAELMCSQAKISRMETGGRGIQARDVRDLCRFYGVDSDLRDQLIRMATEAKRRGWWQDYGSLDEQTQTYVGLESAASSLSIVETRAIPGMLQTRAYAHLILSGVRGQSTNAEIEEIVATRERRAERVARGEVLLRAILDQATLERTFGRFDVLLEQVELLIARSTLPNVTIQILPFDALPSPAVESSFTYLTFANHNVPDVVFIEGRSENAFIDKERISQDYRADFEAASQIAATTSDSREWLIRRRVALSKAVERS